jgi:asparagine synthase (glutamine-hydrolysing)
MLETLASRGPDGAGTRFLADDALALGHQRLAIIDLSPAGAQPMCNEDGSIWLTFNGEIYNYRDLQKQLLAAGHRFRSDADSEVILHAYEEWGDDCIRELRGIFAFGIWDDRRRRLFLARDPLGVKPLYYWRSAAALVFASQPRAILAHPRFRADIDRGAFQNYLAYRYVPDDQAIFQGVKKLPAGHRLAFDAASLHIDCYWRPEYRPRVTRQDEAVELLREKLSRAVRAQMVSDVPLGVFLSGGVDSSTVAAIAASAQDAPLPTFTLGFDAPESDERPYARAANQAIGSTGSEDAMSFDQAVERIPRFVGIYDEPFFDHSGLPTHEVSRLARRNGVKVVLAGDGADELFAGYRWYDDFPGISSAGWKRLLLGAPADPVAALFSRTGFLDAQRQRALLRDARHFDHLAIYRKFFRADVPLITALQLLDLRLFLVDDVLTKVDHASMACGVEVRVPFLDLEVVEAAFFSGAASARRCSNGRRRAGSPSTSSLRARRASACPSSSGCSGGSTRSPATS